jgi:hypothetical protein
MRRLISTLLRAVLVIALVAVVRAVLLDRAPQRAIQANGREPVIGSLAGRAPQTRILRAAPSQRVTR